LSLDEIASRLSFSDASSFSQTFKRWYGVAPGQWRRQQACPRA
jgi:AraC-like DNA-binding protein